MDTVDLYLICTELMGTEHWPASIQTAQVIKEKKANGRFNVMSGPLQRIQACLAEASRVLARWPRYSPLEAANAYDLLSPRSAQSIEEAATTTASDKNTAVIALERMEQRLSTLEQLIQSTRTDLAAWGEARSTVTGKEGECTFEVVFREGAGVDNFDALSKVSAMWRLIALGFARLTSTSDSDVRIVDARNGSLVMTVSAVAGVVVAIGKVVSWAQNYRKRELEIKLLERELAQPLVSEERAAELVKDALATLRSQQPDIVEQLTGDEGDQARLAGDDINNLRLAVGEIQKFLEMGGDVRFLEGLEKHDADLFGVLLEGKTEVRLLEAKLKSSGHLPGSIDTAPQDVEQELPDSGDAEGK